MTFSEYAMAMLGRFGLSSDDVAFIMVEADLNEYGIVSSTDDKTAIKTAIYYQIPRIIAGLSDVSEGGYSVKWNIEGLKLWYSTLAEELGLADLLGTAPTIKDASHRW